MTFKKSTIKNIEASLSKIGLNEHQSIIYKTLFDMGPGRAFKISKESGIKRALTYKTLEQLIELKLVDSKISEKDKVMIFSLTHPSNLENIINEKKNELKRAEDQYDDIFGLLTSSYNLINQKPNIRFWEGLEGLKKIHDDIIKDGEDILLFRSNYDVNHQESRDLIRSVIKRQVTNNIKTRAITPLFEPMNRAYTIDKDKENLVNRRFIKLEKFNIPAQIIIYGNKVAITSYKNNLMNTIIDNKDISESLKSIFEIVWSFGIHPKDVFGDYYIK